MDVITVKQLYKECKKQIDAGNGNKVIMISDDDEGNGYHYLWYSFSNDVKELTEYAKDLNIENLKYLIIVALDKGSFGQKSYRSIDEGFDVGKIAEAHGGSGHPAAAGVNITEKQKEYALVLRKNSNRESLYYLVNSNYNE